MIQTESLERIMKDISNLSTEQFAGRLSGTVGAQKAAKYLAESLREIGYSPKGSDGYFTPVHVLAARLVGPARLIINGKELKHRIDFAEWSPFSSGGTVKAELVTVRFDEEVDPGSLVGKIVLIPCRPDGFDVKGTIEAASEIGIAALLIEGGEPRWFHKTVFGSDANKMPVVRVRRSIAEQYADQTGIEVEMELPLETRSLPCNNVLGYLPGRNTNRTLLLSAHYDHLGDDPGGLRFPGSIDNASGVAVVLELARQLVHESNLPFNILIAFLTGEEAGLRGARQLMAHPPVPITMAINVDGLGYESDLWAMRTGHQAPGHWLADLAADVIQKHGIDVRWIAGGEDSVAYLEKGVPAIGLGQTPTLQSSVSIHTAEDNLEHIHVKPLGQGLSVITEVIRQVIEIDLKKQAVV
jgi:aminopeptidase YwaD